MNFIFNLLLKSTTDKFFDSYGFFIALLILACYIYILYRIGSSRKADWAINKKALRNDTFTVPFSTETAFQILKDRVSETNYGLASADPVAKIVVYDLPATLMFYGMFFVIRLTGNSTISSTVTISSMGKNLLIGPLLTKHHQECLKSIQNLLWQAPVPPIK